MEQEDKRISPPDERNNADEMSEKEIDENLEESFPASDPPSWTMGTDHSKTDGNEEENA